MKASVHNVMVKAGYKVAASMRPGKYYQLSKPQRDYMGVWFYCDGMLKNGNFSGDLVEWFDDRRVPNKAIKKPLDAAWARSAWEEVSLQDLPVKVMARFQAS